ncbi:MAG: acetyl-CoA hydrolase/transferase C-terminal domain-containing protein [Burkholderiales bacterium]
MRLIDATALDFAGIVRPGDLVSWPQANAEPLTLTRTLMAQRHAIGRFRAFVGISHFDTVAVEHADAVDFSAYCGAGRNRALARAGLLDPWCWHYSTIARRFASGETPLDVLLIQVAPGKNGTYSLGVSYEYLADAIARARVVVAEINDRCPFTLGEPALREEDIDVAVRVSRPLDEPAPVDGDATERAVAQGIAGLIEDGATLQVGVGGLPGLVLEALSGRRDLGVHSGQIGDGIAALEEAGVVTNARKSIDRGMTVAGTMIGGARVHRYAHRNPAVRFRSTAYTHDVEVLARIDRLAAVNAAIEVDLTGQVNAEVAGGTYVGAVGGLVDFLRGAHRSQGGLPIVGLTSRHGERGRIVASLAGPASVSRADAGIVVTEHGVADLRGASMAERVRRMIAIAHPDDRENLARRAHELFRTSASRNPS